jgi:plastocyanin
MQRWLAVGLTAIVLGASAGCSDESDPEQASAPTGATTGGSSPDTTPDTAPTTAAPTTPDTIDLIDLRGEPGDGNYPEVELRVVDNEFVDGAVRIDPGVTVAWRNEGRVEHNIVVVGEAPPFGVEAAGFGPGTEHEFRFTEPGVYPYYCSLHGTADDGMTGAVVVGNVPADITAPGRRVPSGPPRTISVPSEAPTIQNAVDSVPPGSLVLIEPGEYHEAVVVTTERLVLRGLSRADTILDGDGTLSNGVLVLADGVAIENMTAREYRVNGFFWNGVTGFRGSYLNAVDNVLYGIYAFDSRLGVFEHSYATGSTDAGFYVGQCDPCDTLVTDVVSEGNQLGFSGVNASVGLSIVESVWRGNRAGIVVATLDSELLPPQHEALIAGNLIDGAGAEAAPRRADGFLDVLYGIGIGIVGSLDDQVVANRITGIERIGIAVTPNPQLETNFWPAERNRVVGNVISGSGLYDLGLVALPDAGDNCFVDNDFALSAPATIEDAVPCDRAGTGDVTTGAVDLGAYLAFEAPLPPAQRPPSTVPPQPELPDPGTRPAEPADDLEVTVDASTISVPAV